MRIRTPLPVKLFLLIISFISLMVLSPWSEPETIVVGSKNFTEGRIMGEILTQYLRKTTNLKVEHKSGIAGTSLAFEAIKTGSLDLYPEYSGTAIQTLLGHKEPPTDPLKVYFIVRSELKSQYNLEYLSPFGFSNNYAIAVPQEIAKQHSLTTIEDLKGLEDQLTFGIDYEFHNRPDGFINLSKAYNLKYDPVQMDHGLIYEAIHSGQAQVTDIYSTDAKLEKFNLVLLEDNKGFFPPYHPAPIVRSQTLEQHPEIRVALNQLAYRISEDQIRRLNYQVEIEGISHEQAVEPFINILLNVDQPEKTTKKQEAVQPLSKGLWKQLTSEDTQEALITHLKLTFVALSLATLFGVPLGILMTRWEAIAQPILTFVSVIQTIPSLAMLAIFIPIPFLGLGARSAIAALFLYSLLPIIRNTYTGILEVDPLLKEAAQAIGLTEQQQLFKVELPLAFRTIMAGIRTSTVIGVGVATLAAFIGAGGLGAPIMTGLSLNDQTMILSGAIPAALLAILLDQILSWIENWATES